MVILARRFDKPTRVPRDWGSNLDLIAERWEARTPIEDPTDAEVIDLRDRVEVNP